MVTEVKRYRCDVCLKIHEKREQARDCEQEHYTTLVPVERTFRLGEQWPIRILMQVRGGRRRAYRLEAEDC